MDDKDDNDDDDDYDNDDDDDDSDDDDDDSDDDDYENDDAPTGRCPSGDDPWTGIDETNCHKKNQLSQYIGENGRKVDGCMNG